MLAVLQLLETTAVQPRHIIRDRWLSVSVRPHARASTGSCTARSEVTRCCEFHKHPTAKKTLKVCVLRLRVIASGRRTCSRFWMRSGSARHWLRPSTSRWSRRDEFDGSRLELSQTSQAVSSGSLTRLARGYRLCYKVSEVGCCHVVHGDNARTRSMGVEP